MALGAWWLLIGLGALWRRTVWREGGAAIRAVHARDGGELRATWAGYELRTPKLRIRWRGGMRGASTLVWKGGRKLERIERWADADAVDAAVQGRPQT